MAGEARWKSSRASGGSQGRGDGIAQGAVMCADGSLAAASEFNRLLCGLSLVVDRANQHSSMAGRRAGKACDCTFFLRAPAIYILAGER